MKWEKEEEYEEGEDEEENEEEKEDDEEEDEEDEQRRKEKTSNVPFILDIRCQRPEERRPLYSHIQYFCVDSKGLAIQHAIQPRSL